MSKESDTYTISKSSLESLPATNLINLTIPELNHDRICIITDRVLNDKQITILNKHMSVYEIVADDYKKHINKLPRTDIYVIPLINNICSPNKAWGSIFYSRNHKWLKQNRYNIVYYRTMNLILDVPNLQADYVITKFPDSYINDKYDLIDQLLYNSIDKHIGFCGLMVNCLCSRITMADCFSLTCGIGLGA